MEYKSGTISKFYHFVIFFNIFILFLSLILAEDLTNITIYFKIGNYSLNKSLNLYNYIIVTIGVIGLVALFGLNIFGSGFNATTSKMFIQITAYLITWFTLSLFTLTFLRPLIFLGQGIYLIFTFTYVFGFLENIKGGN